MVIGSLPQVQQSLSLKSSDIATKSAAGIGNTLPHENAGDSVEISQGGRLSFEREMQDIAAAQENQQLIDLRGSDGNFRLGLMALGQSAMDDWSSKGLELNRESILAAGEAFQNAFRKNLEKNGSSTAGSSIALNRHQIVINSQTVPSWFIDEYENTVAAINDTKLKSAFANGDTFYVPQPLTSSAKALSCYTQVKHSV